MAGRYGRTGGPRTGTFLWVFGIVSLITALSALSLRPVPGRETVGVPGPEPTLETFDRRSVGDGENGTSFVRWFAEGHDDAAWYRSDFDNVDHFMEVGWSPDNMAFHAGRLDLWLTNKPSETNPYTSAEYQKRGRYGFGRFEVVMRAAQGSGLVSSFFTHTDAYFDTPHDEIDFEILGKDTRKVYVNWFTNGESGAASWIDLGFDAADAFHLYAFEWTPETIRWFVDGTLIYERPSDSLDVPVTPGRIIVNLWTGQPGQYDWHGEPGFAAADRASYQCISYQSLSDIDHPQCSDGWSRPDPPTGASLASTL
ncbi:MAG: family 16 glycosylhydrolase [Pseudomonadota bacterium]